MHEFSICQGIITQVTRVAREHALPRATRIVLRVGPLSGVEPRLLQEAFPLASRGTCAAEATLQIEAAPIRVRCLSCGRESDARPNRLTCGTCGHWHTQVISGDEMLLVSVELEEVAESEPGPGQLPPHAKNIS